MDSIIKSFPNKTGVDLSEKDGYAVEFDTDGINVCGAITDQAIGIISKGRASGESDVVIFGDALAKCGAAVTRCKHIIPHTDGTVKDTASSSQEFALALETGVAGDFVKVFVLGSNKTVS